MKNRQSNIRLGIFGFGCVGQGLYNVVQTIAQAGIEVAKICVKDREKPRTLPTSAFTYDPQELLQDTSINILAELISDADEAYHIVKQALLAGRTIVSANKKMLARHLPELITLQQNYGGTLLYEAAVGGSIPIIRTLESYYSAEPLTKVRGILNGSSNYILTKMEAESLSYSLALQQAQELGFAEAIPTLDVGGYDTVNKLSLIAAHGFGATVQPEDVLRFGINTVTEADLTIAQTINSRIRLVATAAVDEDNKLTLRVLPTFVTEADELYYVQNETNGVSIDPVFAGEQFLKGSGAGSFPTGSAVWADVSAAIAGYRYTYPKAAKKTVAINQESELFLYLRCTEEVELAPALKLRLNLLQTTAGDSIYSLLIKERELLRLHSYLSDQQVFVAEITAEQAKLIALQSGVAEAMIY
ncbi:homoserine dehydrogenase [Pontibacter burrus]|uniref:Homoserine dehydrogenase n=1 Tax=Pontibacter burrus TaxID=2704466 RepID=A0A6B3LUX7_9BACT|nr:homoserine dehydrogenase [Pontibacter burrus]NEM97291.1 homoserine dehydrogenase [Pontibacter burrus]